MCLSKGAEPKGVHGALHDAAIDRPKARTPRASEAGNGERKATLRRKQDITTARQRLKKEECTGRIRCGAFPAERKAP